MASRPTTATSRIRRGWCSSASVWPSEERMRKSFWARVLALMAAVPLVTAAGISAQRGMPAAPVGPPPMCPPGGYSPAYYSVFGQNGGDGNTAYEIASPCIGQDVRDAAV